MMPSQSERRTQRPRKSVDAHMILNGAVEVSARNDLKELKMQNFAKPLHVRVTSIYWYCRNKDELLHKCAPRPRQSWRLRLPSVRILLRNSRKTNYAKGPHTCTPVMPRTTSRLRL